ncbi:hypothetical protein BDD30_0469 [Photorhabdus asymbiotica]|nr:hypothetical protein BDD30_0469 [Photorhabdus asymbiotica]
MTSDASKLDCSLWDTLQFMKEILKSHIPVIFQVSSLLAAFAHPGHIVIYAPGDSLPCRRDAS